MLKEVNELIKIYEKWLRNVKAELEEKKTEFNNYPKTDLRTAFLAKEMGNYEAQISVLEIVLGDLKKINTEVE